MTRTRVTLVAATLLVVGFLAGFVIATAFARDDNAAPTAIAWACGDDSALWLSELPSGDMEVLTTLRQGSSERLPVVKAEPTVGVRTGHQTYRAHAGSLIIPVTLPNNAATNVSVAVLHRRSPIKVSIQIISKCP